MTRTCGSIGEEEEGRGSGPARARASGPLSERARVRGQGSVADLGSGQKAMDSCGESIAEAPGARKPRLRARGDCRALFPEVAANRLHLLHASQRRGFGSPRFGVRRAGRGRGRYRALRRRAPCAAVCYEVGVNPNQLCERARAPNRLHLHGWLG